MALAIFDLDNTLLAGDSDYSWGQFLVQHKLVDPASYEQANKKFFQDYQNGRLDIYEYSAFCFTPLTRYSMDELARFHAMFMDEFIRPMITDQARELVARHRQQQDDLLVITATNSFITRPVVRELGIDTLLATDPKIVAGRYTTEIDGTPCYKEGKVTRLEEWLAHTGKTLAGSWFYTDSVNDLALLELVDNPVAVDPDQELARIARDRNWPVISLRGTLSI
jgi:HAD superfamily hydrolase (TIGR01490 family)